MRYSDSPFERSVYCVLSASVREIHFLLGILSGVTTLSLFEWAVGTNWLSVFKGYQGTITSTGVSPPLLSIDYNYFIDETKRFFKLMNNLFPVLDLKIILLISSLIAFKKNPHFLLLLFLTFISLFYGIFIIEGKIPVKQIGITPMFDILIAGVITYCAKLISSLTKPKVGTLLSFTFIGFILLYQIKYGIEIASAKQSCSHEIIKIKKAYIQIIPVGSKVLGEEWNWFFLPNRKIVSWKILETEMHSKGLSLTEAVKLTGADYFIIDTGVRVLLSDTPEDSKYLEDLRCKRS